MKVQWIVVVLNFVTGAFPIHHYLREHTSVTSMHGNCSSSDNDDPTILLFSNLCDGNVNNIPLFKQLYSQIANTDNQIRMDSFDASSATVC